MKNYLPQQSLWKSLFPDKNQEPLLASSNENQVVLSDSLINNTGLDDNPAILHFSTDPLDSWTLSDAYRGVWISGSIGSGKSSGSGKALALAYLKQGFGGLVLCAKPDESQLWLEYARLAGRLDDIIIFSRESGHQFNFLQYELQRQGKGAGLTLNLVALFMLVYQLGQRATGNGETKEGDRFWDNALRRCLIRMIDLLILAGEEISVANMVEVVNSAPAGQNYIAFIENSPKQEVNEWTSKSYCTRCLEKAGENAHTPEQKNTLMQVYRYFLRDFSLLHNETRSSIIESFLGLAEPFLSGALAEQFGQGVTITPELTHEGKIIILDYPVKEFMEVGIYAQGIFKMMWQQATERRNIIEFPLPVFLWVDESQFFITEEDMLFQTTARSSRACTVFLTQNISNYYAVIGGNHPKARVDSLLGNLCTKIFHANNDYETNMWAANTIGKAFRSVGGFNMNFSGLKSLIPSFGGNSSNQLHYQVEPAEFTILRCGGKTNNFIVDGYVITSGKKWSNDTNFLPCSFQQIWE